MRCASLPAATLIAHTLGCTNTPAPPESLTLVERAPTQVVPTALTSPALDDGFGSAVAVKEGRVWIGAPHGEEARVYLWADDGMTEALTGTGRLGAHISSTPAGLLISAPLDDTVVDETGMPLHTGPSGMGIALSSAGDVAWAEGWRAADGTEGTSPGRPTALHRNKGQLAVGMAHGPVALSIGEQQLIRPSVGDEAGFSLSSAEVDGRDAWILGAPAAGRVLAVDANDLSVIREWTGTGRFGHALVVTDVDRDGTQDLVVGAPYATTSGEVVWFSQFSATPTTIPIEAPEAEGAGTAIATDGTQLVIGAPGGPTVAGKAIVVSLPL